jgi:hypothetical protein
VRILYSHRIQSGGGQSVHVDEMVAAFRAEGHEVPVVGPVLHDSVAFGGQTRLQPRVTAYASPLTLIEYIAADCAIAAAALPNIPEVVEDGETALLFDPAAPGAMWQSVKLLTADVILRRRLGDAARACALPITRGVATRGKWLPGLRPISPRCKQKR